MTEVYEFRVKERFAPLMFAPDEGERLGNSVRRVRLRGTDPKMARVADLQVELESQGECFFYGWVIHRRYSNRELDSAELFHLEPKVHFEPHGEETGTAHDDSAACAKCGAGALRNGPLILDTSNVSLRKDMARTIASEWIVSSRLASLMQSEDIAGVTFAPVYGPTGSRSGLRLAESPFWKDPIVQDHAVRVCSPTHVGIDPFPSAQDESTRCPEGHLLGLNLVSEVHISAETRSDFDIAFTREYVGVRRGVIRPRQLLLVSQRIRALFMRHEITGYRLEIVHVH